MKVQERGWPGHFILAHRCLFRRNTLISHEGVNIVVSTVGLLKDDDGIKEVGYGRYFETMVFHSDENDTRYHDADVSKQIYNFDSPWQINKIDADDKANDMHDAVVAEIVERLLAGDTFSLEQHDDSE